jgi:hypothetical protein
MPRRSITETEIGLIKALIARGMKNKDIQFLFNRPERAVNSGRITGIGNGTYSDAATIPAATDSEVDAFLAARKLGAALVRDQNPLSESLIRSMFFQDANGTWHLRDGESDTRECKSSFGLKHAYQWVKAIAALANNRGGYIFFGVADGGHSGHGSENLSHAVIGLPSAEFDTADPVVITSKLKSYLDPTPRIDRTVIEFDGKRVGVIYVEQHPARPIIATKVDGDKIKEGDIYYRYPGQTSRIKYSDLRSILDSRYTHARMSVIPLIERLLSLGPQRALLADLEQGELYDGSKAIVIDSALIEQIQFIREGSFNEIEGAPALKIVGEVVPADGSSMSSRGAITDDNLLRNFLKQGSIAHPREYIRYAAGAGHASWLPLRYFAQKGQLDRAKAIAAIREAEGTGTRKKALISKMRNDKAAFRLCAGTPNSILTKLKVGEISEPLDLKGATHLAQAICGLEKLSPPSGPALLEVLERWRTQFESGAPGLTHIRRAACRLDELLFPFPPDKPDQG